MDNQERHYNIEKLNKLFALASVVLFVAIVAMFAGDYNREWKEYQKDFRALDVEKTRSKLQSAREQLEGNEEYQGLMKGLKEAQAQVQNKSDEIASAQTKLNQLQARYDQVNQRHRFAKAEYDALKYEYETALAHEQSDPEALHRRMIAAEQRVEELRLEEENLQQEVREATKVLEQFTAQLTALEKQERTLTTQVGVLAGKLQKIDPDQMSLAGRTAEVLRNLPILDLANPSYKIEQIVLKDLTDDVNFMRIPKVDRCTTCHLGIANPDYEDAPQPFTTHPNLTMFLSPESTHPLEDFACTTCHDGRGRGTTFLSSAHTPSSPEQEDEWREKYRWERDHHWERPMLPAPHIEASCFKCHSGQSAVPHAEKLNLGLNLIEKAGCYGCHIIEKYADWPKPGPDLTKLASKTTKDWVYRWIKDPQSIRHNTWMPAFFGLSNNSDPKDIRRGEQEIHAMTAYLFAKSRPFEISKLPLSGDVKRGEEIVASYGCFGCHQIQKDKTDEVTTRKTLLREHGPNLIGLAQKTSKEWLFDWLKDPSRYHPESRMPNMRLTDEEAADVIAYLTTEEIQIPLAQDIPAVDEELIDEITLEFLTRSDAVARSRERLSRMSTDEKLVYAGEKLIAHYGCFGCHNIGGFEDARPIGTELTEEGSKSVERLDFGFIHIDHTRQAWFTQKLKDPRIFDKDRVRTPYEKLKMPQYYFSDEEVAAVTTALLGFVDYTPPASKIKPRTPENLFIEEGQKLVRQLNCQGCHVIEGEGGVIQPTITQWLVDFEGKSESEAQAITVGFAPPDLIGEGQKVKAEWLFNFLHRPTTIRPWLSARMPTFTLNAAHLNALVKYFNYLDGEEFPFDSLPIDEIPKKMSAAGEALFAPDYFDCANCHIVGDKLPAGSPDRWAPDFELARERLKPEWIVQWLKNPQELLPGTKMPTYFDPQYFDQSGPDDILNGDENLQIRALRDYILTLSGPGRPAPQKPAAPADAPQGSAVSPEAPSETTN